MTNHLPELSKCPHCGGETRLEPSTRYRWVCGACGGPRVPGLSNPNKALARGREAITAAFGWSAIALVLALMGVAGGAFASILAMASSAAGATVAVVALVVFLLSWRASSRAGARRKEALAAVDEGWREAAFAILRARGRDTTAAELAETMRIEEAEADRLLTELSADDKVRVDVGEGQVRYRVDAPLPAEIPREDEAEEDVAKRGRA